VNNGAIPCRHKIDDLADSGGVLVTGYDERAGRDLGRVSGLIQERPQVTGPPQTSLLGFWGLAWAGPNRAQQSRQLPVISAHQPHGEMRPLRGSQQLEPRPLSCPTVGR